MVMDTRKAGAGPRRPPVARSRGLAALLLAASGFLASPGLGAQASPIPAAKAKPAAAAPAAGERLVLGVEEAVAKALEGNLGLASSRIDAGTKQRKYELAWNSFLPTVELGATLGRFNKANEGSALVPASPIGGGLYDAVYPYSYSIRNVASASLSAQLVLNAGLFEGIKGLRLDYEAGRIGYEQAVKQLERDVRKNFYSILLLEENMKLMERNIEAAERRYGQASANYRSGLAPELTMLQARVAWENMKPALEEMRIGYAASLDAFAMVLGLPRGTALDLDGSISPSYVAVDAGELLARRLGERLDIRALEKSIDTMESTERALRYQLQTPSLVLGWNADPALSGDAFETGWFGKDAWEQSSGMFRITLSMRLNGLLPQSKEAQDLAELRDGIEKARSGLAQALRGAEIEVDDLARKLAKSRSSAAALALNVELAERAYRLSEEAFRAGSKDLLDVQSDEIELQKARLEVLKENFNYVTGVLDLEYAVNLPFGSLDKEGTK